MNKYFVTANMLNLRSTPSSADIHNILTRLTDKEVVDVIDSSIADWYKVQCINRVPVIDGYASSKYLQAFTNPANIITDIKPVHLEPRSSARRNNNGAYAYPLSEPDMPVIKTGTINKVDVMHKIVSYLEVDKSARYRREPGKTYCNIYAYDYCFLTGVFLPRVWWTGKSLLKLKQGTGLEPSLGNTVYEMNANGLFEWLNEWGDDFGWVRTYDLDDLQTKVNEGRTGIICGSNINPMNSGHICCVIPEKDNAVALRRNAKVLCPLTSQAGKSNFQLNTALQFREYTWWKFETIGHFGFWYCEAK